MRPHGEVQSELTDQLRYAPDRSLKQLTGSRSSNSGSKTRPTSASRKSVNIDGPWYRHKTRPPLTNEEKIKSEMCRNLEEKGHCFYGIGCRFAHDKSELKIVMRHPKHKTQLCNDYHGKPALCLFGSRCSYIHEAGPRLRESTDSDSDLGLRYSPLRLKRLQVLEETIHEYSLETVRVILCRKGVSQDDIREIEKLPSVILRLLRRALTSPDANQESARAYEVPADSDDLEDIVTVRSEWAPPVYAPRTLYKLPESLTPPEDYVNSFARAGRGA